MSGPRIVVSPDKFKGSLTAVEAAGAIRSGVLDALPAARVVTCPVADGGEGTLDVLLAAGGRRVPAQVRGPLDGWVDAAYVLLAGTAYVESAQACGLAGLRPSPATALAAHSYGVGTLVAHALEHGARELVLTVGGTACTDGGSGMLRALGARLTDEHGGEPALGGGPLGSVRRADLGGVRALLSDTVCHVATDVTNPLLGTAGAAAVFAPQKGAGRAEVRVLDEALRSWAAALAPAGSEIAETPGTGAGGGLAFGARAGLGARPRRGFELVADLAGVGAALRGADLVITGEGCLDEQSLAGKAPAGVAALARLEGVPVLAVAGRITLPPGRLKAAGIADARALIERAPSPAAALRDAHGLLRAQAADLVRSWFGRS